MSLFVAPKDLSQSTGLWQVDYIIINTLTNHKHSRQQLRSPHRSYDVDWNDQYPSALHHLAETNTILNPKKGTLVVYDDTPNGIKYVPRWGEFEDHEYYLKFCKVHESKKILGKGGLSEQWLLDRGFKKIFHDYQAVFRKE